MSEFKVGDKVKFKFKDNNLRNYYIVEVVNSRIFNGGGYNSYEIKHHSSSIKYIAIMDDELELYKTPHERLIELGFVVEIDDKNKRVYHRYSDEIAFIYYDKIKNTIGAGDINNYWVDLDLELAEILVDYLKELDDNE